MGGISMLKGLNLNVCVVLTNHRKWLQHSKISVVNAAMKQEITNIVLEQTKVWGVNIVVDVPGCFSVNRVADLGMDL